MLVKRLFFDEYPFTGMLAFGRMTKGIKEKLLQ
jgi:hypothetical protein